MRRLERFPGFQFDFWLGIFGTAVAWVFAALVVAWCLISLIVGSVIVARRIAEVMA